ncbi:hypothetical protein MEP301_gp14 [Methylophilales phage MEP301]|nr:hypothetical protein MEP301_gp14 [Methylophilales phage MEP301]
MEQLMSPHEELLAHEKLCAERYATLHYRLDRLESMINKLIWGCMTGFGAIVVAVVVNNI